MTDFCLQLLNKDAPFNEVEMLTEISNYANFLKQPLTLEMFVPCDDDGNVLGIPKFFYTEENIKKLKVVEIEIALLKNKEVENYKTAKSKVLFNGFEVKKLRASHLYELFRDDKFLFTYNSSTDTFLIVGSTIENLIKYNLDLSVSF